MSVTSPAIEPWEVLDLLTSLVQKSLVVYEEDEQGRGRYRLPETVRQYARDRLTEAGEGEAVRGRHGEFFLQFAGAGKGAEQFARLEGEHDNMRAAWEWFQTQKDVSSLLRLTPAMSPLWLARGHLTEGREHLARLLSRTGLGEPTAARASTLNLAGMLAGAAGDYGLEQQFHQESLAIRRALGDRKAIATSLINLAFSARNVGDYVRARALAEESLAGAEATEDKPLIAYLLMIVGTIIVEQGDDVVARSCLERCLPVLQNLREWPCAVAHRSLAWADYLRGDFMSARAHLRESLALDRETGWHRWVPNTLIQLARLETAEGQTERAARLLGAADALRTALGVRFTLREGEEYEAVHALVCSALGEAAFAAVWAEGREMPLNEAVSFALAEGA